MTPASNRLDGRAITIGPLTEKLQKRLMFKGEQNINKNSSYRGFWYIRSRGSFRCEHVVWWMFLAVPKRFKWAGPLDTLRIYIDAWYMGDRRVTSRYEKEGMVHDMEMPDETDPQVSKRIRVSSGRLFAALALQDDFDVPLWGQTAFITNGNYLVPCAFINQLVAADPTRFGHLNGDDKWERATLTHLAKMGLKPHQVTSGLYRNIKPAAVPAPVTASSVAAGNSVEAAPEADDAPDNSAERTPPRERTLLRRDRVDYIEWVTEIIPDDQPPYFCRRLYRDQQMLYEATSYNRSGPWTVYSRDNNALLALGIDP